MSLSCALPLLLNCCNIPFKIYLLRLDYRWCRPVDHADGCSETNSSELFSRIIVAYTFERTTGIRGTTSYESQLYRSTAPNTSIQFRTRDTFALAGRDLAPAVGQCGGQRPWSPMTIEFAHETPTTPDTLLSWWVIELHPRLLMVSELMTKYGQSARRPRGKGPMIDVRYGRRTDNARKGGIAS